jgi:6-pyruvoyltetrahydropterin/6-carboxytetrahydropterin synthase
MFEITVEETFAAGHALRNYRGRCENLHGHNYKVQVTLAGTELNETGLLLDFAELKKALHTVVDRLDHQYLNEVPPFDKLNPSAENMAKYLADELAAALPPGPARLTAVKLWETDTASATYRPA